MKTDIKIQAAIDRLAGITYEARSIISRMLVDYKTVDLTFKRRLCELRDAAQEGLESIMQFRMDQLNEKIKRLEAEKEVNHDQP